MGCFVILTGIFLGLSLAIWPVVTLIVIGSLIFAFLLIGAWVEIGNRM